MGITKNHIHTQEQVELARLFKALGHPARIAIVDNLLKHKSLNCTDLGSYIQLAQSTISAHIKELHSVGILAVRVVGNNAYYQIHKVVLEQMTDYLDQIYEKIDTIKYDSLSVYYRPFQPISTRSYVTQT